MHLIFMIIIPQFLAEIAGPEIAGKAGSLRTSIDAGAGSGGSGTVAPKCIRAPDHPLNRAHSFSPLAGNASIACVRRPWVDAL